MRNKISDLEQIISILKRFVNHLTNGINGFIVTAVCLGLLLLSGGNLKAQSEMSVTSFRMLDGDLTARINPVKNNNDLTCALIKIVTPEKGFVFEPDAMGVCESRDTMVGEIWLFVAPGSGRITIKHPQLGVLRNYFYPVEIKAACTYEMVLKTARLTTIVEEIPTENWLVLTVDPENAAIKIDGNFELNQDGGLAKMLKVGKHTYQVTSNLYHEESGEFEIFPDKKTTLSVKLKPNYGQISVNSLPENGAMVIIDGEQKGTTPYHSDILKSGTYTIQVLKEMYITESKTVVVNDDQTTNVTLTMQPNFASPTFTCSDSDAEIWINDVLKGKRSWRGRLAAGIYQVEARKANHRTSLKSITLQNGNTQEIPLDAPMPIYGKLNISSTPFGADIYLNDEKVGVTPELLPKVLIGDYTLRLEKSGCSAVTQNITIAENQTLTLTLDLPVGKSVRIVSTPAGAAVTIDGTAAGTTPLTTTLSFGTHTVKVEKEGETKTETISVTENGKTEFAFNVEKIAIEMVYVQGGTFTMGCTGEQGSDCYDWESPAHQVTVSSFYMGKYEVTQAQWKAVMGSNPSYFKGDNLPVENVSWNDVQEFIRKLNAQTGKTYRLPTEAEWEYAARGGNKSKGYKYSGSNTLGNVAWYTDNSGSSTHAVGTKSPNESGIYDMSGNVWEWCQDWYGSYSSSAQRNPTGPASGSYRVLRGGSWNNGARYCRVSNRSGNTPDYRSYGYGFRLVLEDK